LVAFGKWLVLENAKQPSAKRKIVIFQFLGQEIANFAQIGDFFYRIGENKLPLRK
jgi:hypothetical protein